MRACAKRRIRREQAAQAIDIAGIHGGNRFIEARVRTEPGHGIRELDMLLEPGPAVEAILAREDQLRVGQGQRRAEDGLGGLSLEPGMMRGDACGG